jgi:hypothetical protein
MVRMRDGSLEPPRRTGSLEQMASLLTPLAASAGRPAGSLGAGPGRRLPSGPPPAAPAVHGVGDHGRDLFDYSRLHEVPDVPQEPVSSGALDAGGEAIRRGWPDTVSL